MKTDSMNQVEKAEAELARIKKAIQDPKSSVDTSAMRQTYYKHLPHHPEYESPLMKLREIVVEEALCQVSLSCEHFS
jgi:hypothetical protein